MQQDATASMIPSSAGPDVSRLGSVGRSDLGDPCAALAVVPADRPLVIAQLGQSLDGRIATLTGESRYINGGAALDHLHRLRSLVDAVVVGVGTVIADDPQLTVRRVPGRSPARIMLDPNGRAPRHARFLADDGVERIVLHACPAPALDGIEAIHIPATNGIIPPRAVIEMLFARGLRRILIEGGARTISSFLDADCIDRLHVLVAPMIIGSGKAGLDLAPIAKLGQAIKPSTRVHVLDDGNVLFDCDLRHRTP